MKSVAPPPTDEAQVAAVLAGDREAYAVLVGRYQDRLFNAMLRMVGSRDDAADLVQDALVQAYVKLDTFRGAARFYTWLYRIAMNLALSHHRRRRPTASIEQAKDAAGEEPVDRAAGPEQRMLSAEQVGQVQTALDQLGDQHRQIIVLREIEGCSYETIAEILGLPVGTVRSRLFRARLQLKELLSTMLGENAEAL